MQCILNLLKGNMFKSFALTEVFDIDFLHSLPHFIMYRSISRLVNISKVDKDFPMSVLYLTESQPTLVHVYFVVGAWKYWLQTRLLMRSALYAVLFVYVLSRRVLFL